MLASMFVVGGVDAVKNPEARAARAEAVTDRVVPLIQRVAPGAPVPDDAATWVRINGATQVVSAAMLASGRLPRLAALTLLASLGPTTLAGHPFWREPDPQARAAQRIQFFKNLSIGGGLLFAALDRKPAKKTRRKSGKDAS